MNLFFSLSKAVVRPNANRYQDCKIKDTMQNMLSLKEARCVPTRVTRDTRDWLHSYCCFYTHLKLVVSVMFRYKLEFLLDYFWCCR